MNYKIAKTMLVLCVVYLIGFYILKFIFPELLLQTITDPTVIKVGKFFDSNKILYHTLRLATSYITYYLFIFASTGRFRLRWYEHIYICVAIAVCKIVVELSPQLYTHTSISVMFLLALICKGKLLYSVVSFVIHGYLSQLLLSIRGFETVLVYVNTLSGIMLNLEGYVWLILLGIIFYIKERNKNGRILTPVYQQTQQANGETISESGKERSES
jgi:hypothetical protein